MSLSTWLSNCKINSQQSHAAPIRRTLYMLHRAHYHLEESCAYVRKKNLRVFFFLSWLSYFILLITYFISNRTKDAIKTPCAWNDTVSKTHTHLRLNSRKYVYLIFSGKLGPKTYTLKYQQNFGRKHCLRSTVVLLTKSASESALLKNKAKSYFAICVSCMW